MAQAAPIIIRESKRISPFEALFGLAVLVGGIWFGRIQYKKYRAEQELEKAGDDPNVQAAIQIRNAIEGIGTEVEGLYAAAEKLTDFGATAAAYKRLYGTTIDDDLKSEKKVTDDVYNKFFAIIKLKPAPGKSKDSIPPTAQVQAEANSFYITIADAWVRKTPVRTPTGIKERALHPLSPNNAIMLIKKGKVLGRATARAIMDSKSAALFHEFVPIAMKVKKGEKWILETAPPSMKVWVAGSGIESITGAEYQKRVRAGTITIKDSIAIPKFLYDNADAPISGLGKPKGFFSGTFVLAAEDAVLRRTPIVVPAIQGSNAVKTVARGKIIGCATGRFTRDELSKTTFYEVKALEANKPNSPGIDVWVERKQIQFLHPQEFKQRIGQFTKAGSIVLLSKDDLLKQERAARVMQSADAPDFKTEIYATKKSAVTSDVTALTMNVPEATILGYKISENDKRIQFQSLNGLNWWVNKENIKEIKK